jgi:hypothetical protein
MGQCLKIPNFTFSKEVINVNGVPITWSVVNGITQGLTPLGIVKDIQIHW